MVTLGHHLMHKGFSELAITEILTFVCVVLEVYGERGIPAALAASRADPETGSYLLAQHIDALKALH